MVIMLQTSKASVCLVVLAVVAMRLSLLLELVNAFSTVQSSRRAPSPSYSSSSLVPFQQLNMIGGKGWDNNSYLDGLDSDDEEELLSRNQRYQEESKARKEFMERQRERMANPQAQKFMEQFQQMQRRDDVDFDNDNEGDDEMVMPNSIHGGSRFQNMMSQSQRMQQMQGRGGGRGGGMGGMGRGGGANMPPGLGGFEQKLAIPLDDDDYDADNMDQDETED